MSKIKNIGDTLPKNTPTTTQKRDFQKDISHVKFTLPVNFPFTLTPQCCVTFVNHQDEQINYYFDYLPNVDVNCYMQYAIQKYQYGVTSDSPKSC